MNPDTDRQRLPLVATGSYRIERQAVLRDWIADLIALSAWLVQVAPELKYSQTHAVSHAGRRILCGVEYTVEKGVQGLGIAES